MAGVRALFQETDPLTVARLLERRFGADLDRLERAVLRAAAGDPAGGDLYVGAWAGLAAALGARPGPPPGAPGVHHARVVRRAPRGAVIPRDRLLAAALAAPVSVWAERAGLRLGLALALLAMLRESAPGAPPLAVPAETQPAWASEDARRRAMTLILDAVRRSVEPAAERDATVSETTRSDAAALRRVAEVFQLDRQGLADVFGVRRQAVDQWFQRGVPADRQAKLAGVLAIAELLSRKLRAGAVPGVARTVAPAYRNRTMLQMLAADEHDALLADVRASFDWATSA